MKQTRFLDRSTPPHLATLIIATATGALAMNVFLPSLPTMARDFDADYSVVQLAVSLYIAATAVLQLVVGPASDRFGRRPVMLTSFVIFVLATLAAIFATSIVMLLVCRVLQGFAVAGVVLSRAIVRDTVSADQAASRLGYVTMGMAVVPMVAPLVGGLLDEAFGWRATFVFTLGLGLLSLAIVYADLGETRRSHASDGGSRMANYRQLFASRRFWGYTLTAAFSSGSFFAFLGGGPYVASEQFDMSPSVYGLYFALLSLGYMVGNFFSGRFSATIGVNSMSLHGCIVGTVGAAVGLVLFMAGITHPLTLFGAAAVLGIGNGMTLPNANAGIVSVRPHLAGTASGLGGAMQIGGGALMAFLTGLMLTAESGAYPLFLMMLLSSVLSVFAALYVIAVARREAKQASHD